MKYTKNQIYTAVRNRDPNVGTHLAIDDWAAECWTYQVTDPETGAPLFDENGDPIMTTVCTSTQEFIMRLSTKYAIALWYNPDLPSIYFESSPLVGSRLDAFTDADWRNLQANTFAGYLGIWDMGGPGPLRSSEGPPSQPNK